MCVTTRAVGHGVMSSAPPQAIWTKITTATDTSNVKHVFDSVVAIIAQENMKAYDNMG